MRFRLMPKGSTVEKAKAKAISIAALTAVVLTYIAPRFTRMLKRCVNPACHEEFKLLNGGDLYALERRSTDTEFFWLCSTCACMYELYLDATGYVTVRTGSVIHHSPPPHPDAYLRLISRQIRPRPNAMPSGERTSTVVSFVEPYSLTFSERGGILH